jgi:hypothetical protein
MDAQLTVVLIRDYILKIDLHRMNGILFLFFQLALVFVISVISQDFYAQVYILILIGEFTFHRSGNGTHIKGNQKYRIDSKLLWCKK